MKYFLKSLKKINYAPTSTETAFGIARIAQQDYLVYAKLQLKARSLTKSTFFERSYLILSQSYSLSDNLRTGVYDDHTSDRGDYNDCPNGWFNSVDDVTGHYCIKAFSELETQKSAETVCNNQHGGSLVSIHGPDKNQRVGQGEFLKLES